MLKYSDKLYKRVQSAGTAGVVVGIISIVTGLAIGIVTIVFGGILLSARNELID